MQRAYGVARGYHRCEANNGMQEHSTGRTGLKRCLRATSCSVGSTRRLIDFPDKLVGLSIASATCALLEGFAMFSAEIEQRLSNFARWAAKCNEMQKRQFQLRQFDWVLPTRINTGFVAACCASYCQVLT